jgi:glutathione S-transferase
MGVFPMLALDDGTLLTQSLAINDPLTPTRGPRFEPSRRR